MIFAVQGAASRNPNIYITREGGEIIPKLPCGGRRKKLKKLQKNA